MSIAWKTHPSNPANVHTRAAGGIIFVFIVALAIIVLNVRPARSDTLKIEGGVQSGYLLVDPHVMLSDEAVHQGSIFYFDDNGLYGGLWWSNEIDSFNADFGNNPGAEIDLVVGWSGEYDNFVFDISAAEWFMPGGENDIFALNGKMSRSFDLGEGHSFEPYIGLEGQWFDDNAVSIVHVGATHRVTIDGLTLANGGRVNFFDEGLTTFVYESSLTVPLNEQLSVVPYFKSSYYFGSGDCTTQKCGPSVCDNSDWDSVGGVKLVLTLN